MEVLFLVLSDVGMIIIEQWSCPFLDNEGEDQIYF